MTSRPSSESAFSVCVYCGSRTGVDPIHHEAAREVGAWIGERGGQLVYGGGNAGLMGVVATATLEAGGRVVGVIPRSLVEREFAKRDCTELHVVETMHERKRLMAERAGAFLALAGGIGTFEEFFEVWTWRQLGYHDKPVGLLNTGGFYDQLVRFIDGVIGAGFMNDAQRRLITVGDSVPALMPLLIAASLAATGSDALDRI